MLDFNQLRGGPDGWRGAFERLVCHLAEINPPQNPVEFRSIEGAGGDGGIEAYWVCEGGGEIGYQAKFHVRAGDIDWSALGNSISTALTTHPTLTRIFVAMPCDLTDVKRGRGRSARERWNDHRERWEAAAAPRKVAFEFVGASQIERLLTKPAAAGLREYWFNERELSDAWFRDRFARTVAALDERYHPEDHVDVKASDLFSALRGSHPWRSRYRALAEAVAEALPDTFAPDQNSSLARVHAQLAASVGHIISLAGSDHAPDASFPIDTWKAACEAAILVCKTAQAALREDELETSRYETRRWHAQLGEVRHALSTINKRLKSPYQLADQTRYAIVEGEAGGGKSHLIATEIEAALNAGDPAVMLLGTDFTPGDEPGVQIARRLELTGMTTETLLGALEAAARARGRRAIIAIDALNEGAGARYWRDRLAAFAADVRRYPRLTLCVSCRDVYSDRVFTSAARTGAAQVEIAGFETEKEQEEAAAVYMDRRGISRPASPWLPPEFTNPLFLRTTCIALEQRGEGRFPLGLRGAREMLRFYLQAAASTLGTTYDGTDELERPLIRAVLAIASEMASTRLDYVERQRAATLVDRAFGSHQAPMGHRWIDLLRLRGLLRADPPEIEITADDPLDAQEDVLRFAFQRIQDQLIAKSLTQSHDGPKGLFGEGGPLAFLLGRWGVEYDWRGVFMALAVEFADRWGAEVVDYMPGDWQNWWNDQTVQEAFIESIRWRQHDSFSDHTLKLLNQVEWPSTPIDLLIELSIVEAHPWNAEMLHRNLSRRAMPQRDAFWTARINGGEYDERSAAGRLADWGLGTAPLTAGDETIRLALITLGWIFTSSNGGLRDRATKAATEILLRHPAAAEAFVERFAEVDDVYVLERVLAALAGACLRDPQPARLKIAAAAVWREVFDKAEIPKHLLLRDYGRIIIDLAAQRSTLPPDCDLDRCRPPYRSTAPRFGLDKAKVEAECQAVGDHSIFSSVAGWGGDFGKYVVESRVRSFTSVRRTQPRPLRHAEAFDLFKKIFVEGDEFNETLASILEMTSGRNENGRSAQLLAHDVSLRQDAETALLERIGVRGRRQYEADALPFLRGEEGWKGFGKKLPVISKDQARLWIARQAIRLGWTKQLFPNDHGSGRENSRATRIERIGKKYQWIAHHELFARLADNFWLAPEWESEPVKAYDTPLDISFLRDIDPTIRPQDEDVTSATRNDCPSIPRLALDAVPTSAMADWVFEDGVANRRLDLALCPDLQGAAEPWLTLYRYASRKSDHPPVNGRMGAPFRLNDFHFVLMAGVEPEGVAKLVRQTSRARTDFHSDWMMWGDLTDGPYLHEAGVRATWPDAEWVETDEFRSPSVRYLRFTRGYRWEHHLDGTLSSGLSLTMPNPWLLRELALNADPHQHGVFLDADGRATIISGNGHGNAFCIARRDAIEAVLARRGVTPVWVGVGERGAWPNPAENAGPQRRWNGVMWREGEHRRHKIWAEDHRPGQGPRMVHRSLADDA